MRYQVRIEPDYLKVEVSQTETPGEAKELLYAITEAVFKHGRKPILVCAMRCQPLSLVALYSIARHVIDTPLRHGKIAFLYDADRELESSRFIEELGEDRGLDIAVFRTEAEAVRWFGLGRLPGN